ncbi:MAG TPA: class I SAM-dependent methyltransferase [Bryobacteraceae bacterium]
MHELLGSLPPGARVLDLGSARGSFRPGATAATVIALDREIGRELGVQRGNGPPFVCADAAHLPFGARTFKAIVANHSLEHFEDLSAALAEIARVIRPEGVLFVAVPDASTLTDKLYRWLGRGGGHVNAFTSAEKLAPRIEQATGLAHAATLTLYSSLAFLNRRNAPRPVPRKLLFLGGGAEWALFLYVLFSRRIDEWFGFRTSVYGWALYFGALREPIETRDWRNVCIRCGSGFPAPLLRPRRVFGIRVYRCPACRAPNPFFER